MCRSDCPATLLNAGSRQAGDGRSDDRRCGGIARREWRGPAVVRYSVVRSLASPNEARTSFAVRAWPCWAYRPRRSRMHSDGRRPPYRKRRERRRWPASIAAVQYFISPIRRRSSCGFRSLRCRPAARGRHKVHSFWVVRPSGAACSPVMHGCFPWRRFEESTCEPTRHWTGVWPSYSGSRESGCWLHVRSASTRRANGTGCAVNEATAEISNERTAFVRIVRLSEKSSVASVQRHPLMNTARAHPMSFTGGERARITSRCRPRRASRIFGGIHRPVDQSHVAALSRRHA